jgi:hypothetical protein
MSGVSTAARKGNRAVFVVEVVAGSVCLLLVSV